MTTPFAQIFQMAAQRFGVPQSLLMGMAKQESNFNPKAVSPAGAQGVMQLMPATAEALGIDDPFDPVQSIVGGAAYLRQQLDQFGNVEQALAAYNAGPGRVQKAGGDLSKLPSETQQYVPSVLRLVEQFEGSAQEIGPVQPVSRRLQPVSPARRLTPVGSDRLSPVDSAEEAQRSQPSRAEPVVELRKRQPVSVEEKTQPQLPGRQSTDPRRFFSDLTAARGQPPPGFPRSPSDRDSPFDNETLAEVLFGMSGGESLPPERVEQPISPHPRFREEPFPVPRRSKASARLRQEIMRRAAQRRQRLSQSRR